MNFNLSFFSSLRIFKIKRKSFLFLLRSHCHYFLMVRFFKVRNTELYSKELSKEGLIHRAYPDYASELPRELGKSAQKKCLGSTADQLKCNCYLRVWGLVLGYAYVVFKS